MNRSWIPLILLLLLSACGPDYSIYSGPDLAAAVAQATAASKATQDEQFRQDRQATLNAGATRQVSQAEMERLDKEIQATQAAVRAQQTIDAGRIAVLAAQGTATAQAQGTTTAWPQTATPLAATQAAVVAQVQADQRANQRAEISRQLWIWVWPIVTLLGCMALIYLAIILIPKFFDWIIEWLDRQFAWKSTRDGILIFEPDDEGVYRGHMLTSHPRLPAHAGHQIKIDPPKTIKALNVSGSVLAGPMGGSRARASSRSMAIRLVEDSIGKLGEASDKLAGWRDIGWSSSTWQSVIRTLERRGLVATEAGVGAFVVGECRDLGDLLFLLETKPIWVQASPAPAAGVGG